MGVAVREVAGGRPDHIGLLGYFKGLGFYFEIGTSCRVLSRRMTGSFQGLC